MTNRRITVLKQAMEAIDGSRDRDYGTPEDNFNRIAGFWAQYLGMELGPWDVANMMILLKVARSMNDPTVQDNWVDIAGYAGCGGETAPKQ